MFSSDSFSTDSFSVDSFSFGIIALVTPLDRTLSVLQTDRDIVALLQNRAKPVNNVDYDIIVLNDNRSYSVNMTNRDNVIGSNSRTITPLSVDSVLSVDTIDTDNVVTAKGRVVNVTVKPRVLN